MEKKEKESHKDKDLTKWMKSTEPHRFKKGNQYGKLGGRPKGTVNVTDALRRVIERDFESVDPFSKEKAVAPVRDWVAISLLGKALKGDVAAIREVMDRLDGKALSKVEVTGKGGAPLQVDHKVQLESIYKNMNEVFGTSVELVEGDKDD